MNPPQIRPVQHDGRPRKVCTTYYTYNTGILPPSPLILKEIDFRYVKREIKQVNPDSVCVTFRQIVTLFGRLPREKLVFRG